MRYTLFGESHGPAVGILAEGFAPGIAVDQVLLEELMRRRRGGREHTTQRREEDKVQILSGVYRGKTTGDPICIVIENTDVKSEDYAALANVPRPSHGDYAAYCKSKGYNDPRGGGHLSARLTAPVTALGAVALSSLAQRGIGIGAHLAACGGIKDDSFLQSPPTDEIILQLKKKEFPTLNETTGCAMRDAMAEAREEGESLGGAVECAVLHLPAGMGGREERENLQSRLASELFSLPGVKGCPSARERILPRCAAAKRTTLLPRRTEGSSQGATAAAA